MPYPLDYGASDERKRSESSSARRVLGMAYPWFGRMSYGVFRAMKANAASVADYSEQISLLTWWSSLVDGGANNVTPVLFPGYSKSAGFKSSISTTSVLPTAMAARRAPARLAAWTADATDSCGVIVATETTFVGSRSSSAP